MRRGKIDSRELLELGRREWVLSATKKVGRGVLLPFFRLETEGVENLPSHEAFILLPKHQRWEDIPLLSLATPRPLYYVAKYELFANRIGSWYLRALGGIPLNRERPLESRRSLKALIQFLKGGEGVVVFPEGTYYVNEMGPGNVGIVRLILSRLTLPFIPVGIHYEESGPRTWVRIRFGKPLRGDSSIKPVDFVNSVMKEIGRLSGIA